MRFLEYLQDVAISAANWPAMKRHWPKTFSWGDRSLDYCRSWYHCAWSTERVVEIPIVHAWLHDSGEVGTCLEVGNVLAHYCNGFPRRTVIDLYERGSGVRNEDIVTCNLGMYDTGICISTLEHIPETEGRTGQDSIIALRRLQAQCTSLFVSVPCGYNDRLESAVASELGMAWAYRRVSHAAWEQVEPKDVIGSTRSGFVRGADAVVIGASRRDFGGQDKSEDIARNDVQ